MTEYEGERFVLYSFYFLPVMTKELATGESLMDRFHCIPDGEMFDDRMAKAVRITKRNKKKILEEEIDPDICDLFADVSNDFIKHIEWVERSW